MLFHVFEINSRTVPQDLLNLVGFPRLRQNLTEILEDLMKSTDPDSLLLECAVQFEKLLKTQETTKSGNNGIGITWIQFNQIKFSDGFIRCLN